GMLPRPGYRIVAMRVDRDTCPPGLTPNLWVDVMAKVVQDGKPAMIPVIQRVLIKAVNGVGTASGARSIDSVGLEMKEADARKFMAFADAARGQLVLMVRSPDDPLDDKLKGGFNPELDTTGLMRRP
ncbi:MAG: hypothetical protein PHU85_14145, partial [Phycisphaerae bacterium]|nr:hypothetical protein [Phycisphaerae bacterium]